MVENLALIDVYKPYDEDGMEVKLYSPFVVKKLRDCKSLNDVIRLVDICDNILDRRKDATVFKILHDAAILLYSLLTDECECYETFGYENYW